jgi:hypothetical protein
MNSKLKSILTLAIVSVICAILISLTHFLLNNDFSKISINNKLSVVYKADEYNVVDTSSYSNSNINACYLTNDDVVIIECLGNANGKVEGYNTSHSNQITILIAIGKDDKTINVVLYSANSRDYANSLIKDSFYDNTFNGKSDKVDYITSGIDGATGATNSADSIIDAFNNGIEFYNTNKSLIRKA